MYATAQDAHIGIGHSCINSFLDFPILMNQKSSIIPNFDAVIRMTIVLSCFAVYVLANDTQVVPYFSSPCIICQYIHSKTAKQLKTMYYSLIKVRLVQWNKWKTNKQNKIIFVNGNNWILMLIIQVLYKMCTKNFLIVRIEKDTPACGSKTKKSATCLLRP